MLNTPIDVVLNIFWERNHVLDKVTDLEISALLLLPAVLRHTHLLCVRNEVWGRVFVVH